MHLDLVGAELGFQDVVDEGHGFTISRGVRGRVNPRDAARDADVFRTYVAIIAQNFNTRPGCGDQAGGVGGIQVGAGGEAIAVGALDDEQLHGPRAVRDLAAELPQVLGRAGGDTVGKFRQGPLAAQVAVLQRPFSQPQKAVTLTNTV
jgi:hypothetical protein